ncbi:hypothetical protein ACIBJI_40190 [Nocardia sp. NPDC050408]|uniref:hypothetical protein n=1 Tax=Nocardia sp. NPDC050408 TaxID=3364319 RepID=UPI003799F1C2
MTSNNNEINTMEQALRRAHQSARVAAEEWNQVARTLTTLRSHTPEAPSMPASIEEWHTAGVPTAVPFTDAELGRDLHQLTGLITKAFTLSAIYTGEADRMSALLAQATSAAAAETPHGAAA